MEALAIGIKPDEWWNLTPREGRLYFKANALKNKRTLELLDTANFILGRYIRIAFNDPKHYPDKPAFLQEPDDGEQTTETTRLNALFGSFATKSNKLTTCGENEQEAGNTQASEQK